MKILNFAPEDYPAIVDIHNSLNIVWPERPRTPEAWAAVEQNRDPKWMHQRWVAVEDGHVVGFSSYEQNPWSYPPKSFYVNIEIHSEYQRRGIGTALYDQIMEELQMFNPPALRADAFANLPQGFTFLKKRGIFLKRFTLLLGVGGSVLLTSIVFALMHGFAFYFMPTALPFFVLNTLSLGLACGYLMMKADNIWGAILIHAASDSFLFIAVLANA